MAATVATPQQHLHAQPTTGSPQPPQSPQPIQPLHTALVYESFLEAIAVLLAHPIIPEQIEGLDTLYVYVTNLTKNPTELKFHTISAINIHFWERLGHFPFVTDLLYSIGFLKYTVPVQYYKYNSSLLSPDLATSTLSTLNKMQEYLDERRQERITAFTKTPQLPPQTYAFKNVIAAGCFHDRGRRNTMEDTEIMLDNFLYSGESSELHKYKNLSYFGVYDGHGGVDTSDFVVKVLHDSIAYEMGKMINAHTGTVTHPIRSITDPENVIIDTNYNISPPIKQTQQFYHITNQQLIQLPHFDTPDEPINNLSNTHNHNIQQFPSEDEYTTNFSGKTAFKYFIGNTKNSSETNVDVSAATQQLPSSDYKLVDYKQVLKNTTPSVLFPFALTQAHVRTDNQLRRCLALSTGCTTVSCIVGEYDGQKFCVTSNLGDSRAVLAQQTILCCQWASYPSADAVLPSDQSNIEYNKPSFFLKSSLSPTTSEDLESFLSLYQISPEFAQHFHRINPNVVQNGDTYIDPQYRVTGHRLTVDHKATLQTEANRITSLGGVVSASGRTMAILAVSRALGDHNLKSPQHFVSAQPHIDLQLLNDPFKLCLNTPVHTVPPPTTAMPHTHTHPHPHKDIKLYPMTQPFLVLACDGVWDVMSDHEVMSLVSGLAAECVRAWLSLNDLHIYQKTPNGPVEVTIEDLYHSGDDDHLGVSSRSSDMPQQNPICLTCLQHFIPRVVMNSITTYCARRVVEAALTRGSTDNVTVMVVRL